VTSGSMYFGGIAILPSGPRNLKAPLKNFFESLLRNSHLQKLVDANLHSISHATRTIKS